jgi:hypothetical protein
MLTRWPAFTRFFEHGRICLSNNAAERALRGMALGRKSRLFAGSERGAERAALMYTLTGTAKLNDVDPQTWLAEVLARIAEYPAHRLNEFLPWNWGVEQQGRNLAAWPPPFSGHPQRRGAKVLRLRRRAAQSRRRRSRQTLRAENLPRRSRDPPDTRPSPEGYSESETNGSRKRPRKTKGDNISLKTKW